MSDYANPSAELRARVALEKHRFHNTHSLGQNFLLSQPLIDSLLDAAGLAREDCVLEIGPGAGVMTRRMAERAARVLAVEVDRGLEPVLADVLDGLDNVRVTYRDILRADVTALAREAFGDAGYRVIANLPYYITADALLKLASCGHVPQRIDVMVQREAAQRLMSEPGERQWCALAAQLRLYGRARVLAEVPPHAFTPPPHVDSCFVAIERHREPIVRPKDERVFLRVLRAAFAMRRKTLANNLRAAFALDQADALAALESAGLDARVRGEALTLEELCRVADAICEASGEKP